MLHDGCGPWLALQVVTRKEMQVGIALRLKGHQEYVPTYIQPANKARLRPRELPLFPGYVFCRIQPNPSARIISTPGVIRFVAFGGKAAIVDSTELANVQQVIDSGIKIEPWEFLNSGDRVLIEEGPLRGITGILASHRGRSRIVVSVNLLMRSIAAEVDSAWVTRIASSSANDSPRNL